eukprot:m.166560 g.166560  ORF g.166560 m.166560 type:complete len:629 (-) comp15282_c0_seq5:28-1914(-)
MIRWWHGVLLLVGIGTAYFIGDVYFTVLEKGRLNEETPPIVVPTSLNPNDLARCKEAAAQVCPYSKVNASFITCPDCLENQKNSAKLAELGCELVGKYIPYLISEYCPTERRWVPLSKATPYCAAHGELPINFKDEEEAKYLTKYAKKANCLQAFISDYTNNVVIKKVKPGTWDYPKVAANKNHMLGDTGFKQQLSRDFIVAVYLRTRYDVGSIASPPLYDTSDSGVYLTEMTFLPNTGAQDYELQLLPVGSLGCPRALLEGAGEEVYGHYCSFNKTIPNIAPLSDGTKAEMARCVDEALYFARNAAWDLVPKHMARFHFPNIKSQKKLLKITEKCDFSELEGMLNPKTWQWYWPGCNSCHSWFCHGDTLPMGPGRELKQTDKDIDVSEMSEQALLAVHPKLFHKKKSLRLCMVSDSNYRHMHMQMEKITKAMNITLKTNYTAYLTEGFWADICTDSHRWKPYKNGDAQFQLLTRNCLVQTNAAVISIGSHATGLSVEELVEAFDHVKKTILEYISTEKPQQKPCVIITPTPDAKSEALLPKFDQAQRVFRMSYRERRRHEELRKAVRKAKQTHKNDFNLHYVDLFSSSVAVHYRGHTNKDSVHFWGSAQWYRDSARLILAAALELCD